MTLPLTTWYLMMAVMNAVSFFILAELALLIFRNPVLVGANTVKGPETPKTKEGRKWFINDALNTFYLRLYGVRHMVKLHSDRERGNPLPPHGLLFH